MSEHNFMSPGLPYATAKRIRLADGEALVIGADDSGTEPHSQGIHIQCDIPIYRAECLDGVPTEEQDGFFTISSIQKDGKLFRIGALGTKNGILHACPCGGYGDHTSEENYQGCVRDEVVNFMKGLDVEEDTKETEPFNYFLKDGVACDPEEEYGFEASYYIDNDVWTGLYTNFVGLHYVRFHFDGTTTVLSNYSTEPSEDFQSKGWRVRSFASDQDHFHFPRMDLDPSDLEVYAPEALVEGSLVPVPYEDYIIEYDATLVSGLVARHLDALLEDLNDMAATDTNNCPPPDHPIVKASQRKLQHLMETWISDEGHAPLDFYSDEEGQ